MSDPSGPVGLVVQRVVEPDADQGVHPEKPKVEPDTGLVHYDSEGVAAGDDPAYPVPTDEERQTLRKVSDNLPWVAFVLCVVECAERASYYGASGVFNNFVEYPLPKDGPGTGAINGNRPNDKAGALAMGVQASSGIVLSFKFLAYVLPILGAWIADTRLGRYKTIMIGVVIGAVAHIIMIGAAAPALLQAGRAAAPFLLSLYILAIGAGIFKPNVAPTIIDQYTHQREYTKVLKSGEKVLVDPETTVQRIMLIFYASINIGAFFAIGTTYSEKYVGFWLAFLLPGIVYFVLPIVLIAVSKKIIKKPPKGSELTRFFKLTFAALRANYFNVFSRTFWDKVQPGAMRARGVEPDWTERNVMDAKRTWEACRVFLYVPIWNINDGGVGTVQSNQGGSMITNGAPNDLLNNFNPLTIIVFAPFMSYVVYPLLARYRIKFGRISRLTVGFVLCTLSGVLGAVVQWYVYNTSPCGYYASTCDDVSPISIWWQLPNVILGAISEVFVQVTTYEMAYARAPPNMKATVMAINLFMLALSNALAEILIPAINDPTLIWAWAAPAIALAAQTVIFWFQNRHMNDDEFMLYEDSDVEAEEPIRPDLKGDNKA